MIVILIVIELVKNLTLGTDKIVIECDKNGDKRLKTYTGNWLNVEV